MKNLKKMFFFFLWGWEDFFKVVGVLVLFWWSDVVVNYFNWGFGFVMWGVFFFGG